MDLYQRKSRWKIYLAIAGLFIITISASYTKYIVDKLAEQEKKMALLWTKATQEISEFDDEDYEYINDEFYLDVIRMNNTIPAILVDERGNPIMGVNFGEGKDMDTSFLKSQVRDIIKKGGNPIESYSQKIYYKNSTVFTLLTYYPVFQFVLIAAFISFGYLGFSSSRRAEQNRVWAGLAKETAHQLGTPISAILAWIEHLKMIRAEDEEVQEVVHELGNDVERLNLIADRFSKIGSAPKLKATNIYTELEKCRTYMQRRASRKVAFDFPEPTSTPIQVNINPPLFDWVIENLLRNALDAMSGKGKITATVYESGSHVMIDISDTGKGIPSSKFKTVFQPGFTTKKRGWGLGLSLAKRIIETYHSGRIFVKKSVVDEGTTFTIRLPKY